MSYLTKDINIMGIRSTSDYLAEQNIGVRRRKTGKGEEKAKETWLDFPAWVTVHSPGLTELTLLLSILHPFTAPEARGSTSLPSPQCPVDPGRWETARETQHLLTEVRCPVWLKQMKLTLASSTAHLLFLPAVGPRQGASTASYCVDAHHQQWEVYCASSLWTFPQIFS